MNNDFGLKTTIYTNGMALTKWNKKELEGAKLRVSVYCDAGNIKSTVNMSNVGHNIDINFMVSAKTTLKELLNSANYSEEYYKCKVFFISSIRELSNSREEFFDDTINTMPVIQYKELVHRFLHAYTGKMDIHVSKRGVFESTTTLPDIKCRFANYFMGGKSVQCPYDIINERFQYGYSFGTRYCQHNNTCLMSKVIYRPI